MDYKDIFSEEDLRKAIATYFSSNDFEIVSNNLGKADEKLIGFLGEHLRMKVQVAIKGKLVEVPLFIKMIPVNNNALAEYISKNNFYQKEMSMYEDVLRYFPGHEEPSPWMIKSLHMTENFFIFEDVSFRGFKSIDQRKYMTLEQCYAVIRTLAKLHATSVLFERKRTKELGRKMDMEVDHPIFTSPNNFGTASKKNVWFNCGATSLVKFIGELSQKYGRKSEHFQKIANELPELFSKTCELIEPSDKYINVLTHTDLWQGNLLLRSSKQLDAIVIDFQCLKYCPGTVDLAAFLHISADKQLRDEHEEDLLRFYKDVFNKGTADLEHPNEILSWEEVQESYDQSRLFGFVIALILFPYILLESETAEKTYSKTEKFQFYNDVDRSEPMISTALSDKVFGERMLKISEEFIEKYIIKVIK